MGIFATSADDPQYAMNMGLFSGLARGDAAGGVQAAQQGLLQRQMLQAELAMKQLAEKRAQAEFDMTMQAVRDEMGGGQGNGAPAARPGIPPSPGGPLGSGTYGILTGGQDASAPVQGDRSDVSNQLRRLSMQALLGIKGVKERLDILKYRNDPQKVDAGSYTRNPVTNEMTYNPDPVKGVTMGPNGSVQMMPNADAVQGQLAGATARAQEGAKDQFAAPTTINLPGGPRLMSPAAARGLAGGAPNGGPPADPFANMPAPQQVSPGTFVGRPEDAIMAIAGIPDPQQRANALASFTAQLKANGGAMQPAAPALPGIALQTPAEAKVAEERGAGAINAAKVAESTKPLLAAIDQALAINSKVPYGPFGMANGQRNFSNLPFVGNGEAAKYAGQWDQLMGQNIMNGIASSGLGRMDIPIVNAIKAANGIPMENHPAAREQMLNTLRALVANHALSAGNVVPALNQEGITTNATQQPMQAGTASQAPSKNMLAELPKNARMGARVRDTETGQILKFNGFTWKPE